MRFYPEEGGADTFLALAALLSSDCSRETSWETGGETVLAHTRGWAAVATVQCRPLPGHWESEANRVPDRLDMLRGRQREPRMTARFMTKTTGELGLPLPDKGKTREREPLFAAGEAGSAESSGST